MEINNAFLALIFSPFFITLTYFLHQKRKKLLPPGPPPLPILGHLHLLKNTALHLALEKLSLKYGPLISLRFGIRPILIVSSPSLAEECFTKNNDVVFANRPETISGKYLGYNSTTVILSPYGDHWRNLRRVTTVHIFSSIGLNYFSSVWAEEICFTVKNMFSSSSSDDGKAWKAVGLQSLFSKLVFNVVMKMVAGKRWPSDQSGDIFLPQLIIDIGDYIPILRWFGFGRPGKNLIISHEKRDKFLQDLIDEARKSRGENDLSSTVERRTIVEILLSLQDAEPEYYTEEIVKGIMQVMFTAATHTSSLTMARAMSFMLNDPDVLLKARNEIDNHVTQSGRLIEDSDLSKLPYLRCIINETLRITPAAPTLSPHYSSEDCTIGGYNIPKGTTLIVNAWAIQRDPSVWEEPNKFKPERFEGIDDHGFNFLPFGKGRRTCPGAAMAMRVVGLALGTLIQCFEWEKIEPKMGESGEQKPSKALYKPRLSMVDLISQL